MKMSFAERLKAVDAAQLTPLVRQALADDSAELLDWELRPVKGGIFQEIGGSYGLYRFRGSACCRGGATLAWSLILKATAAALVDINPAASPDISDLLYWKREVLAYQSGLLADLSPGLRAVRCFAVVEYPEEEFWIWLEDVEDRTWSRADYGLAAYHLGLFNGAYLGDRQLPQADWLSHGQAPGFLGYGSAGMAEIASLGQLPANRLWLDDDGVARTQRLWEERERLLSALDRLPQTFCHHDAFRRNLMIRSDSSGELETVAVDWAMVGTGWASVRGTHVPAGDHAAVLSRLGRRSVGPDGIAASAHTHPSSPPPGAPQRPAHPVLHCSGRHTLQSCR